MDTIIARDIAFYEGDVETHRTALARCTPGNEPVYEWRIRRAQEVVAALKAYAQELGVSA